MMHVITAIVLTAIIPGWTAPQTAKPGSTPNTLTLADGAARPPARIADMAWLAGQWHGTGLGGEVDEVWSAPAGNAMVGHFRLIRDGKPVFYEILTILEVEGSLEMRLKHVNPDMSGWEEKADFVTFKLARMDKDAAYFSGFTMRRSGPDTLDMFLALRNRADGTVREEKFTVQRVK